jgi:hypothetical protein
VRYYNLVISDPDSGLVWQPSITGDVFGLGSGGSTFTSLLPNGNTNPGALNIEFDLPVIPFHTPQGGAWCRVWGIGLSMIGQSANLNQQNFVLSAGMQKGLPLANPAQSGVIAQGSIFQAFGNWQGTTQTLDLILLPGGITPTGGVAFSWTNGVPLATALYTALSQGFPGYLININISNNLQPPQGATQAGTYSSLQNFAQYLNQLTLPLGAQFAGAGYPGVSISIVGNTLFVYDGTEPPNTINLAFQDLIGQPTWLGITTISFKTVLRADIKVGDQIMFPAGIVPPYALTTPQAALPGSPARSKVVFQNAFVIVEVHHYANLRQADADSWNTTFKAALIVPS